MHVRIKSPSLVAACKSAGMPDRLAETCSGLLASVVDDLDAIGRLPRSAFERSKRMERVLAATSEPAAHALKLAMAVSPVNGRACARHWDAICDKPEVGRFAWLLGMNTDTAYAYGKRMEKRS